MAESEPSPTKLSVAGDTLEYPVDLQRERECYHKHHLTIVSPVLLAEQKLPEELESFIGDPKQEASNHGSNKSSNR